MRSPSNQIDSGTAHTGIVYARIAARPEGISQPSPLSFRHGKRLVRRAQGGEEHRRARAEAQRPKRPRRHFAQDDLHRRPVESPGERKRREHPPQPGWKVIRLSAQLISDVSER
jgi:hypothetical protein